MATKKKWSEFSPRSRRLIVATSVVEVVLLVAALVDLKRRPAEEVRGSKRMWSGLVFVNIVGPIAYFALGRRPRRGAVSG